MLSGGLDSRVIAASAVAAGRDIVSFNLGAGRNVEGRLARRVAESLGIEHHELPIPSDYLATCGEKGLWYTDAMFVCSHLHWLAQVDYLESKVHFMLSGYLGGFLWGGVFLNQAHLDEVPKAIQGKLISQHLVGEFSPFLEIGLTPSFLRTLKSLLEDSKSELAGSIGNRGFGNELDRAYLSMDERRFTNIGNIGMLGTIVDVKYPFGDYELLDFYAKLPVSWRSGCKIYKAMVRSAIGELAEIPCISANTKFVPTTLNSEPSRTRIFSRRVMAQIRFLIGRLSYGHVSIPDRSTYVHYGHWYRTDRSLRHWVKSVLLDERTLGRGYYDREGVKKLLRLQLTRGYLFDILARMITFEYWNRFFIDGNKPLCSLEMNDP